MNHASAAPALVILAAGLGSRYGDAKQVAGVGPDGEWLLEYAIHDALVAGYTQVVMVIREELRDVLRERLAPRIDGRASLDLVEQTFEQVPEGCRIPTGRRKPLGTGHALWCCKPLLRGTFAAINADDYYGRAAFQLLAQHFSNSPDPAMVGYRLDATLSPHGGVNRGVCRVDADGFLADITEYTDIAVRDGQLEGKASGGTRRPLAPDTVVSLNCWGLTPRLFPELERGLRAFLDRAGERDEYFLPHAIDRHLASSGQRLAVLQGNDEWLGLTYPDDHARVAAAITALHKAGAYPTPLWANP